MACPSGMELETKFGAALDATRSFRITGNRLDLVGETGVVASLAVKKGDKVSTGSPILTLTGAEPSDDHTTTATALRAVEPLVRARDALIVELVPDRLPRLTPIV